MTCTHLLKPVTEIVLSAGNLLCAEWERSKGPRGQGDKAEVDAEIESRLAIPLTLPSAPYHRACFAGWSSVNGQNDH